MKQRTSICCKRCALHFLYCWRVKWNTNLRRWRRGRRPQPCWARWRKMTCWRGSGRVPSIYALHSTNLSALRPWRRRCADARLWLMTSTLCGRYGADGALYFGDASSLSALLARLACDPQLLVAAQRRSRRRAERYNAARMAEQYLGLYRMMGPLKGGSRFTASGSLKAGAHPQVFREIGIQRIGPPLPPMRCGKLDGSHISRRLPPAFVSGAEAIAGASAPSHFKWDQER